MARARLIRSDPSTVPIRTSEFVMADLLMLSRLEVAVTLPPLPWGWYLAFLWRAQRKEPGWVVGEHMHVRR